jgi:small subunit ribosomal protein S21
MTAVESTARWNRLQHDGSEQSCQILSEIPKVFLDSSVIFRIILPGEAFANKCLFKRREGRLRYLPGVRIRDDESFEKALRRFNKFCEKSGVLSDIKKHQHFEKPSDRRKRKINAAKRKARRSKTRPRRR